MSGFNYARSKATADRLIKRFGKSTPAVFSKLVSSGPSYDPTLTPSNHDVTVVVLDYSIRQIDGTRILAGDKHVLIAVGEMTETPDPSWTLTIGSKKYQLITLSPLEPGDVTILWDAQCRAA